MRTLLVICCALILGCPASAPVRVDEGVRGPDPTEELKRQQELNELTAKVGQLSKEAEALLRDQDELIWKSWTEGAKADIEKSYEGHDKLFTADNIRAIERFRLLTAGSESSQWSMNLKGHFIGEYLARELSEVTEAIANLQASVTFPYEGKDVPYRDLDRMLSSERSAEKRKALYEAATPAVQRIAQSWKRKDERIDELLKGLGYESYLEFAAELRQADLEALPILATQVLDVTDEAWKQVLTELSKRELQAELSTVTRADFPRLFRAHNVDDFFAKDQVLPRAKQTMQGLKLRLDALRIDEADKRTKNQRALTLPVRVPTDVRVSLRPSGGVRAQGQALHELGHALHYAHTDAGLRFELSKLGNDTAAEAMGFLFEDLTEDPVWLEQLAGMSAEKARGYLWAQSAHKLFVLRRSAARILFELQLHGPGAPDAKATYAALMTRAYGVPVDGVDLERAGTEREDFLESADEFRAAFLAGQLQGQLKARFGPSWWNTGESSEFLKKLWAKGNSVLAREVAAAMGDDRIKPDVLLLRISSALQIPITLPAASPHVDTRTPAKENAVVDPNAASTKPVN